MRRTLESISDVVATQLCTGCGVCAYMEPLRFSMEDTLDHGRRPFQVVPDVAETGEAIAVCPGAGLSHPASLYRQEGLNQDLLRNWGPVYGVWEGYAADPEIRYAGSSGGAATALALFCLEKRGMSGVLHTAARTDLPYLNESVMSTTRAELLVRTGSRYAPASPAEALDRIEAATSESVFIGKPCDAAAAQNARKLRPALDKKLGLVIAFFCAGVPSTKGNLELLRMNGVEDPSLIRNLRYRGMGWPGLWSVSFKGRDGKQQRRQMTYAESWGVLQRYRQWRCYVCPDHTGEFADIAVGDPWYREVQSGEAGKSLIIARTQRGVEFIKAAASSGYLVIEREDPELLPKSQSNLLKTRGALWGRLNLLRTVGAGVPKYSGFMLFHLWLKELSWREKAQSIFGTIKRVRSKGLRLRTAPVQWTGIRK